MCAVVRANEVRGSDVYDGKPRLMLHELFTIEGFSNCGKHNFESANEDSQLVECGCRKCHVRAKKYVDV